MSEHREHKPIPLRHRPAAEAQARIDRLEQLLDQAARAISLLTVLQQEIIQTLTQEKPDGDRSPTETPPAQDGRG